MVFPIGYFNPHAIRVLVLLECAAQLANVTFLRPFVVVFYAGPRSQCGRRDNERQRQAQRQPDAAPCDPERGTPPAMARDGARPPAAVETVSGSKRSRMSVRNMVVLPPSCGRMPVALPQTRGGRAPACVPPRLTGMTRAARQFLGAAASALCRLRLARRAGAFRPQPAGRLLVEAHRLGLDHHAVVVPRALDGGEAVEHVGEHQRGLALQRLAVAARSWAP